MTIDELSSQKKTKRSKKFKEEIEKEVFSNLDDHFSCVTFLPCSRVLAVDRELLTCLITGS